MADSDTDQTDVVPPKPWTPADLTGEDERRAPPTYAAMSSGEGNAVRSETMRDHAREFLKGVAEMSVEFGKGCRDIVKQSLVNHDSFLVRKFGKDSYIRRRIGGPCQKLRRKLSFFNEYLPEDKDPLHSWSVILFVALLAFAGSLICDLDLTLFFFYYFGNICVYIYIFCLVSGKMWFEANT